MRTRRQTAQDTRAQRADDLLKSLTHGPTPSVDDWEILESSVDHHGVAQAILRVNGHDFAVDVYQYPDGE